MDVPSCQKVRIIHTFPWIFVLIFFIFGFSSSLIGCLLINYSSYLRFVPFLVAVIFEMILAPLVGLLKSYHLQYLRSELFDSFNCCGVNSYQDWVEYHRAIPKSCCAHMQLCTLKTVKEKIGCYEAVQMDVFSNWNAMIMFIIIFICIKSIMLIMYKCSEISHSPPIHPVHNPRTQDIVDRTLTQQRKHSRT